MIRKIQINVTDTWGIIYPVRVPLNWTVEQFINDFLAKINSHFINNHRNSIPYEAILKRTNIILDPQITIQQSGIKEGDDIQIRILQKGGGIRVPAGRFACFPASTKIMKSPDETEYIENLKIGDTVLSYSVQNGQLQTSKVKKLYKGYCRNYYEINERLAVTGTHLLYSDGIWKRTSELRIGDFLETTNGKILVEKIKINNKSVEVFNLEIEDNKTFFAEGILVHNLT